MIDRYRVESSGYDGCVGTSGNTSVGAASGDLHREAAARVGAAAAHVSTDTSAVDPGDDRQVCLFRGCTGDGRLSRPRKGFAV